MDKNLQSVLNDMHKVNRKYCETIRCGECEYNSRFNGIGVSCALYFAVDYLEKKGILKEPEIDWSKVEVDTKILVRNTGVEAWDKRYFSKFKDGRVYAFSRGATSFSSDGEISWDEAKLYKEEI